MYVIFNIATYFLYDYQNVIFFLFVHIDNGIDKKYRQNEINLFTTISKLGIKLSELL